MPDPSLKPYPIPIQNASIEMEGRWASCWAPNKSPDNKMSFHDCCLNCLEQARIFRSIAKDEGNMSLFTKLDNAVNSLGRRLKLHGAAKEKV